MPPCHCLSHLRFCAGQTIVVGNQTVFAENLLWSVVGDPDNHCAEGQLIPVYPPLNVFVQTKPVIVAVGDIAAPDLACVTVHPTGPTNPVQGCATVFCYPGGAIG